jgi:aldose sugar dehydrogenase
MRRGPRNAFPRTRTRVLGLSLVISVVVLLAGPAQPSAPAARPGSSTAPHVAAAAVRVPPLQVTRIATGLDIPWDVKSIGGGKLLITERTTRRLLLWEGGSVRALQFPSSTIFARGETGLMGLAVDPAFATNRRFYTCHGGFRGTAGHDVRVVAWRLNAAETAATAVRTLLYGIPVSSTIGQHGGCRLLITSYGALIVGTGDARIGRNPRHLYSLGGKTLRLNRFTGAPWPYNRYIRSRSLNARYVLTRGHRNPQGLAQRSDGTIWSVEHGPDRDDEVNRLATGGDYGWHPVPGYNQRVPMTNHGLPGTQVSARWRSGSPTLATSGAAWVLGQQWGDNHGTLAVATLKGQRLLLMKFDSAGRLRFIRTPSALRAFGRLRAVTRLGSGDLLVTTSNGGGNDAVLRVRSLG